MFRNSDFNTKKYIILLLVICIVFFIVVIKAFEYLPVKDEDAIASKQKLENINSSRMVVPEESNQEEVIAEKKENKQKHVHIDLMPTAQEEKIEEIKAPAGVDYEETENTVDKTVSQGEAKSTMSAEEKAVLFLYKGHNDYINGIYSEALQNYRSVIQLTKDANLVASAYEGIAQVYAANRKYGTALTFAIKAYSISPSSSREMLLARLYYKTGDLEKATKRINNILHRDFTKN